MLDLVLKWLVPFLLGSAVSIIGTIIIFIRSIKNGLCALLRADIINQHEKWMDRGYCPVYAKEALTKEYKAYHMLGGNDVATELYKEIMALPIEKGVTKHK